MDPEVETLPSEEGGGTLDLSIFDPIQPGPSLLGFVPSTLAMGLGVVSEN